MLVGLAGAIAGYNGSFTFESGHDYPDHVPYVSMRIFIALFGAAMVPMAYLTALQLRFSQKAAFLAATMVLFGTFGRTLRHPGVGTHRCICGGACPDNALLTVS